MFEGLLSTGLLRTSRFHSACSYTRCTVHLSTTSLPSFCFACGILFCKMADPLSLLREYNVNKKEIVERNGYICFGDTCWPKNTKTNYVFTSFDDRHTKEYFTLDCLLFLLRNVHLPHLTYVKQTVNEQVPVVSRPFRKDLLAYLFGETNTSPSIDRSCPLEPPISLSELEEKFGKDEEKVGASGRLPASEVKADDEIAGDKGSGDVKRFKLDSKHYLSEARKQFSERLDAPRIKKTDIAEPGSTGSAMDPLSRLGSSDATSATSLTQAMTREQIAALKAKRMAKKRSTIIDAENEFEKDGVSGGASAVGSATGQSMLLKHDANFTKEIREKERVWRNRTTILQSTGKNFAKSILPILQAIKFREDGSNRKPTQPTFNSVNRPANTPVMNPGVPSMSQQYNRYDQERFTRSVPSNEFRIDTTGSYHGFNLKNVTEVTPTPKAPVMPMPSKKRTSKTPIIIIPATTTSLITMYNAKAILQDLKYIDGNGEGVRDNEVLIQRRKAGEVTTVPYRVIDNPLKLMDYDWERVVAVFVQGPAWQFKGWPFDGNPVEIFARIKAFHLKWDEMKLDANVSKWNVQVIELSRNKRHLDRANLLKFWSSLDAFMVKNKHYLRF